MKKRVVNKEENACLRKAELMYMGCYMAMLTQKERQHQELKLTG